MIETKLQKILDAVEKILINEPLFIDLSVKGKRIVVLGDLHGDIDAVNHVLKNYWDDNTILVCGGDYVDRAINSGDSIKVLTALFELKINHPDRVFLLRGNHEFAELNQRFGFRDEVEKEFSISMYDRFADIFKHLPLMIRTDTGLIILHGGLPDISSMDDLKNLSEVEETEKNKLVDQILWNDCFPQKERILMDSPRGVIGTFLSGEDYFKEKMKILNANVLIRGHEFIAKGIMYDKKCVTLHTTKLYAEFPTEDSKFKDFEPIRGRTIAIIPPKEIKSSEDLEIVDIDKNLPE